MLSPANFRALAALVLTVSGSHAALMVNSPTSEWIPILYTDPNKADPANDQQTNILDGDIVGNATHPSFYMGFYDGGTSDIKVDGEIGFRLRVAGDKNPSGFNSVFWVGVDVNRDGKVDLFMGVKEKEWVGLVPAGDDDNISPSTTSIDLKNPYVSYSVSAQNYSWMAVNATNDPTATQFNLDSGSGGGATHTDHFISFVLPFGDLVSAVLGLNLPGLDGFNEDTPLQFVAATSNQPNSLNQDLNGISGGVNSTSTWTALGGFTPVISSNGTAAPSNEAIPEPGVALLAGLGGLLLLKRRRALVA